MTEGTQYNNPLEDDYKALRNTIDQLAPSLEGKQGIAERYTAALPILSNALSDDSVSSGGEKAVLSPEQTVEVFDFETKLKALFDAGISLETPADYTPTALAAIKKAVDDAYADLVRTHQSTPVSPDREKLYYSTRVPAYEGLRYAMGLTKGEDYTEAELKTFVQERLNFTAAFQIVWKQLMGSEPFPNESVVRPALNLVMKTVKRENERGIRQSKDATVEYSPNALLNDVELGWAEVAARVTQAAFTVGQVSVAAVKNNPNLINPSESANFGTFSKMISTESELTWGRYYRDTVGEIEDDARADGQVEEIMGGVYAALQVLKDFMQLQKQVSSI